MFDTTVICIGPPQASQALLSNFNRHECHLSVMHLRVMLLSSATKTFIAPGKCEKTMKFMVNINYNNDFVLRTSISVPIQTMRLNGKSEFRILHVQIILILPPSHLWIAAFSTKQVDMVIQFHLMNAIHLQQRQT